MPTLHLLSSCDTDCLQRCLNALSEGDTVLLIAEGVLAGVAASSFLEHSASRGASLFALKDDCRERGLTPGCPLCGYPEWVSLVETHARSVSWS